MPIADKMLRKEYAREWMASRRSEWFADKVCAKCGSKENLELDHIDPSQKTDHKIWSWSKDRREAELAKCQPLCHDCHAKKTHIDRGGPWKHGASSTGYRRGCRCDPCKDTWLAMKRAYRARGGAH